jgi:hypothetical protein
MKDGITLLEVKSMDPRILKELSELSKKRYCSITDANNRGYSEDRGKKFISIRY